MEEITLQVQRDEDSGWLVASWDDPAGGGITTQGEDLRDLQQQITDAVSVHFDEAETLGRIRIRCLSSCADDSSEQKHDADKYQKYTEGERELGF
jgi:predicted RNase H-like HicB family nuclease